VRSHDRHHVQRAVCPPHSRLQAGLCKLVAWIRAWVCCDVKKRQWIYHLQNLLQGSYLVLANQQLINRPISRSCVKQFSASLVGRIFISVFTRTDEMVSRFVERQCIGKPVSLSKQASVTAAITVTLMIGCLSIVSVITWCCYCDWLCSFDSVHE
jgi:hypothetical protein